jgi:N-acetyl-alpha-D-muramate 1-phosphate uridylyltransferase
MILAAGLGTRMRPLTNILPKPLIKVAGKALIDYILDDCRLAGVTRAVVNVHYLADLMEAHVRAVTDIEIIMSDERAQILDSGGGVLKAMPHLGTDPFFIMNADAIWLNGKVPALVRLMQHWNPETMDVLLLLANSGDATGWSGRGDFAMNAEGQLTRAARTGAEMTPHVYAGAGIWKPELFRDRPEIFSLNKIFDETAAEGRLHGLELHQTWMHVGTPEAIPEAEAVIARATGKVSP